MQFNDDAGKPLELLLYKRNTCPYCVRVMQHAESLGLQLPMRDTERDAGARQELGERGGKTQVPCLFINGQPLYESSDIMTYLQEHVRRA